jgi:hypothetical protein
MLRKILFVLLALTISMTAQARHGAAWLKDPPTIEVPKNTTLANVETAIVNSAAMRGWRVIEKKPGLILLQYAPRDFSATVSVTYSAEKVNIAYKDSSNLEYGQRDGQPVIHPNYNRWVNNLYHDIDVRVHAM